MRGDVALSKASLLSLAVPSGTQPCDTFGLHPALPTIKALYDAGDAAFLANVGTLVGPLTKAEFTAKSKPQPPALFAHNTQVRESSSVHAQNAAAKGVLGRMVDALTSQSNAFKAQSYSISGSKKIVEGENPVDIIGSSGVQQFLGHAHLGPHYNDMNEFESESMRVSRPSLHRLSAVRAEIGARRRFRFAERVGRGSERQRGKPRGGS